MQKKRLRGIASLVTPNAKVIDIGTDHAYLPIYLYQENITHNITASDISKKVLEFSLINLKKQKLESKIALIESDGFKNIEDSYDEAIIAGMGTNTIIDILNTKKLPNSLIIQSNNDHYQLRAHLNKIGYKIEKEIIIKEKGIYYVIIKYIKGREKLNKDELLFGKSNDLEYLKYLSFYYHDLYLKSHQEKYLQYEMRLEKLLKEYRFRL